MKQLFLIFSLITLISCSGTDNEVCHNSDYYFGNAEKIQGVQLKENYPVMFSFNCFHISDGFLGAMDIPGKGLIHLADLQTGEIISSVCHKGRGPKELLSSTPQIGLYNNTLYVTDMVTDKIKGIFIQNDSLTINDITQIKYTEPTITANSKVINDSLFVIFGDQKDAHQLLLCNNDGVILNSIDYHILDDENIDLSKVPTFYVSMDISPCREYLYVCNKTFNHVKKYHIHNNTINHLSTFYLTEPKYTVKKGKPITEEDNVKFSANIFVNEQYIYIVANPESRGAFLQRLDEAQKQGERVTALPDSNSYILVFNHKMELLNSYLCDTQFETITLTPDPSIVYAADYRSHGLTEYKLTGLN